MRESLEVYSRGLARYPDNPWLYRHRGHRYISVRDFPAAIRDLERATMLVQGKPDIVEEDGQPNTQNKPIGTLHSNIGYHLALAYYLQGNVAKAAAVAREEFTAATNDDRRVSMAHWLYLGRQNDGEQLLQRIVRAGQWGAFGTIAAEAQLARIGKKLRTLRDTG